MMCWGILSGGQSPSVPESGWTLPSVVACGSTTLRWGHDDLDLNCSTPVPYDCGSHRSVGARVQLSRWRSGRKSVGGGRTWQSLKRI